MPDIIHKNFTGAEAVHPAAYVQSSDPGTVGANKFWIDTTTGPPYVLNLRNSANTAWVQFGATGLTGATGSQGATGAQGPIGTNAAPYVCIQDQKAQNTAGGTFTSGAFQTRALNTVLANDSSLASLLSNQITLPAGTYRVAIKCPGYRVGQHQARLQNITNASTALTGTSNVSQTTIDAMCTSDIIGRLGITTPTVFEVQHRCTSTGSTNGFGLAANFGIEVYTVAEFWLEGLPPPFIGSTRFSENPSFDRIYRQRRAAL